MKLPKDELILELYEEFVENWIKDVNEQFDELVATKNTTDFYRLAHTLKGSGYQFEIPALGDKGVELMDLVKAENWEKIIPYKKDLLSILNDALNSYREYAAKK